MTPTPMPQVGRTLGLASTSPAFTEPAVEDWVPEQVAQVPLPMTPTPMPHRFAWTVGSTETRGGG